MFDFPQKQTNKKSKYSKVIDGIVFFHVFSSMCCQFFKEDNVLLISVFDRNANPKGRIFSLGSQCFLWKRDREKMVVLNIHTISYDHCQYIWLLQHYIFRALADICVSYKLPRLSVTIWLLIIFPANCICGKCTVFTLSVPSFICPKCSWFLLNISRFCDPISLKFIWYLIVNKIHAEFKNRNYASIWRGVVAPYRVKLCKL